MLFGVHYAHANTIDLNTNEMLYADFRHPNNYQHQT